MKKRLFLISLLCLLLVQPLMARDLFTIKLNNMTYVSHSPMIISDDTPYVSLKDLESLVLATVTPISKTSYKVNIGKDTLEIIMNSRQVKLGKEKPILEKAPLFFNNEAYVPINDLLDIIHYPYTWDEKEKKLSLDTLTPHSPNGNDVTSHLFKFAKNNLNSYKPHLLAFTSLQSLENSIALAQKERQYLSFMDNSSKPEILKRVKEKITRSPYHNISLKIRQLDLNHSTPKIKSFTELPITLAAPNSDFLVKIGDEDIKSINCWPAFYPNHSLTDMDIDASIDATLMRYFYSYFRDLYNLRDDKYFKSTLMLSGNRTTTLRQNVYTLSSQDILSEYAVYIYRLHPSGSINYVVDLVKK